MNLLAQSGAYLLQDDSATWAELALPLLGGNTPTVTTEALADGWLRVRLTWQLDAPLQQDELAAALHLRVEPNFWWAPHLAPNAGDCIAQHAFRSPALIVSIDTVSAATAEATTSHFILVPDLDICGKEIERPWFLDLDAPARTLAIGLVQTAVPEHVRFQKIPGLSFAAGRVEFGFFVTTDHQTGITPANPPNPFAKVSRFLWARYAQPLLAQGQPLDQHLVQRLDPYVKHVYHWAFNSWKEAVWQEFEIDGKRVGAPAFIVNVSQSPNYPGEQNLREILSVWNQAWFSSLRSAAGLYRHIRQSGDDSYLPQALMTKEFALAAPLRDGIFPAVYRTQMTQVEIDGKNYARSLGWQTGYWCNSNRTPRERGIDDRWYHILDASWTALNMVRWYQELEQDARLLDYAKAYAEKLLTLQDGDGFFPAWLHPDTLAPSEMLAQSPETSLSVTFLLALAEATGDPRYQSAALTALDAVITHIIPAGRWEDFETYWSCSQWGKSDYYGKRIPRNGLYKQCNFSMFWTAEALLAAYRLTHDARYLRWGRRTLDELAMTQQVWQPPYIYIPALGGFGVMNFDGEWNDSRQSLFAELFMDYYRETGEAELFERGLVALKAAFVMMYCPENPQARTLWEQVWPFFGPEDYGFTMENYGHSGRTSPQGEGIGEFTIYDWGNGAAAEAFNRIRDHYGDLYLDTARGRAFAINGVSITAGPGGQFTVKNATASARDLRLVTDTGESRQLHLAAYGESIIQSRAPIG